MSTPVAERCARVIATRVANVTVANGYSQTLTTHRPTKAGGYTPADNLAVITQLDPQDEPLLEAGNPPMVTHRVPYEIAVYVRPSDTDDTATDALLSVVASDVRRAVTNAAAWWNFTDATGATAINAMWSQDEKFTTENGQLEGVRLTLVCEIRTSENNPTEAR